MGVCCSADVKPCLAIIEKEVKHEPKNLNGFAANATDEEKATRTARLAKQGMYWLYYISLESNLACIHKEGAILRNENGHFGSGIQMYSSTELAKSHIPKDNQTYVIIRVLVVLGNSKDVEKPSTEWGFLNLLRDGYDSVHQKIGQGQHVYVVYNYDQILHGMAEVPAGHEWSHKTLFSVFVNRERIPEQETIVLEGVARVHFSRQSPAEEEAELNQILRTPMKERSTAPTPIPSPLAAEPAIAPPPMYQGFPQPPPPARTPHQVYQQSPPCQQPHAMVSLYPTVPQSR